MVGHSAAYLSCNNSHHHHHSDSVGSKLTEVHFYTISFILFVTPFVSKKSLLIIRLELFFLY